MCYLTESLGENLLLKLSIIGHKTARVLQGGGCLKSSMEERSCCPERVISERSGRSRFFSLQRKRAISSSSSVNLLARAILHLHGISTSLEVHNSLCQINSLHSMKSAKAAVSENFYSPLDPATAMAPGFANGSFHAGDYRHERPISHTITGLRRWSVANKEIPGEPRQFVCTA